MKTIIYSLLLFVVLIGCIDGNEINSNDLNSMNVILGNEKPVLINDKTIRMKVYYYVNASKVGNGSLLDKNLISFVEDSTDTGNTYKAREISTTKIKKEKEEVSILVLVDKSVGKDLNRSPYKLMERQLMNFFLPRSDYEINVASFAVNNPVFKNFSIGASEFGPIRNVDPEKRAFSFDVEKNGGTTNLAAGLDSALNFISRKARNKKRAILILTNEFSFIGETKYPTLENKPEVQRLISKAKSLNTSISFFNTSYPSSSNIVHHKLVSGTGGVQMSWVSSTVGYYENYDLMIPAYFDFLSGINYYESILEIKSTDNSFKLSDAFFFRQPIKCYNYTGISAQLCYEK